MKKKVVILFIQIVVLLLFLPAKLHPQILNNSLTCLPVWGTSTKNGSAASTFNSVAVDTDGNVYVAGYIQSSGTCSFGNGIAATGFVENARNAVLVKFNSTGKALWAKTLHDSPLGSCYLSVKVDSWGNVYTAGYVHGGGTYDFGDGVRAEPSAYSELGGESVTALVLVKYNSSGSAQWARTVGGDGNPTIFHALAVDAMGNVYAAGRVTTIRYRSGEYCTYDYGNGVIVSAKSEALGTAAVLVKYSSAGKTQWARTLYEGSSNGSTFYSVTVDGEGGIYAAGAITSNPPHLRDYAAIRHRDYQFGNNVGVTVDRNFENLLLVKYDSKGEALWARTVSPGTDDSRFSSVAVDLEGNLYAAGYIKRSGTYNFGNGVSTAASESSSSQSTTSLLVKYDPTGRTQWARTGNPTYFVRVNSLAITVNRKGIVYTLGSIQRSSIRDSSGRDIWKYTVLTQYDSTGASRAVVSYVFDGYVSSDFNAVTTDLDCNIYLAGRLSGNGICDFGYGITLDVNGTVTKGKNGIVYPSPDEHYGVIMKFVEQ